VLDRGFANLPTLERLFKCEQSFIIHWKSSNLLTNASGETKNTWRICFGKKSFHTRLFSDKERKITLKLEIMEAPVCHPQCPDKPLNLIVVRHKTIKGQQPMYRLTDAEVDSIGIAWEIFKSYIHRWDIEQAFRFLKSELGIQAIRLRDVENRRKMMALVTLIYEFLRQFWRNGHLSAFLFIKKWCQRTDKRLDDNRLPLYRLSLAFANCLVILVALLDFERPPFLKKKIPNLPC
jgi:Transposase DDE domain